jgi:hypothetical protein
MFLIRGHRLHLAIALGTLGTVIAASAASCGGGSQTSGNGGTAGSGGGHDGGKISSSSSSSGGATDAGDGGDAGDAGDGSDGAVCTTMPLTTVLAVNKLYFGEGPNGEWKSFGFNLDGKVSTATSTDLCQPNGGAAPSIPYPDGNNGIDNSFGKNLLPTILGFDPTWPADVNASLTLGSFTVLLELDCLPLTGVVPVLNTKLFGGGALSAPPKFDGTDKWPVVPELLTNPMDPESSTITFPNCSVDAKNTFSAGKNGTYVIIIPVLSQGQTTNLKLTLHAAQVTMNLTVDRKSAVNGMIGGVLNAQELITELKKVAYLLQICGNAGLAGLEAQVLQACDILTDGTQDTTKVCDGISVGIGFDMKPAQIGAVAPPAPISPSCQ